MSKPLYKFNGHRQLLITSEFAPNMLNINKTKDISTELWDLSDNDEKVDEKSSPGGFLVVVVVV